jgi:hypothetical protein
MASASDYPIGGERVGELGWGDDEIEEPSWDDVATKLKELASGEHELVTLRLTTEVAGERPPTLFAVPGDDDDELAVYFRSADYSLHTGRDSYSLAEVVRIFRHFYEELELDPGEDWDPD